MTESRAKDPADGLRTATSRACTVSGVGGGIGLEAV
jgi:hypothetical protein